MKLTSKSIKALQAASVANRESVILDYGVMSFLVYPEDVPAMLERYRVVKEAMENPWTFKIAWESPCAKEFLFYPEAEQPQVWACRTDRPLSSAEMLIEWGAIAVGPCFISQGFPLQGNLPDDQLGEPWTMLSRCIGFDNFAKFSELAALPTGTFADLWRRDNRHEWMMKQSLLEYGLLGKRQRAA